MAGYYYLALDIQSLIAIFAPGNGYETKVSADAAGIIVTLYGLNRVSHITQSQNMCDKYYHLFEFADQHEESDKIHAAMD